MRAVRAIRHQAGDLFTRITVAVATVWILLCCLAILTLKSQSFTTGVTRAIPRLVALGFWEDCVAADFACGGYRRAPPPPTPSATAETETEPEADSEPNTPSATEPDESGPPSATSQPEGAEASVMSLPNSRPLPREPTSSSAYD